VFVADVVELCLLLFCRRLDEASCVQSALRIRQVSDRSTPRALL
jgi:hypothetical protein